MTIMKKQLFTLLLPALLIFPSCSEDETTSKKSVEEAKLEIENIADQASQDVMSFVESKGINGAIELLDLIEGYDFAARQNNKESIKEQIHLIAKYFVYGPNSRVNGEGSFSFDDIKGLYKWNVETQSFDELPSDFFIVKFPVENSESNNAELKISELEFITITKNDFDVVDEYQIPSLINAYLKINNTEVISLDYSVDWSFEGFPEKADITLYVDPFTFTLGFDQTFEKTSSLVTSVKLDETTIIGIDVEFQTIEKEVPQIVEGFVQYYNLKISGRVDATMEEGVNDINDFVDLDLLLEGEKIGDIVFDEGMAYVKYNDGSKQLFEEILEPVIQDIESALEDFK